MCFQDAVDRRIEELRSAIEYQTPVKLKRFGITILVLTSRECHRLTCVTNHQSESTTFPAGH